MPPTAPTLREAQPGIATASRWRAPAALGATLLVFGAVMALVSLGLRARLHEQILRREGEILRAVALMQREVVHETTAELGLEGVDVTLEVALHTSKLRGVLAVRLFDAAGAFLDAVPIAVFESTLTPAQLETLAGGRPAARFHERFALDALFITGGGDVKAPMLEVAIPLPASAADADDAVIVQYWIAGSDVAAEFARLDTRVAWQAGIGFGVGGLLITGAFLWAFRRLAAANRELRRHATDLARANRELAQTARTSALGAITAHLMHGLRNPLAGLEGFVAGQAAESDDRDGEWASAVESTRRLRALVNEVQSVLSDVATGADFEITTGEMCAGLRERLQAGATARGVDLVVSGPEQIVLGAREAGLGGFVLANLVQNAIEASANGQAIFVTIGVAGAAVDFRVRDEGPGLSVGVAEDPFRPRRSGKPDGAGIGLAISRELARHAGGELVLEHTGAGGTVFRLRLPKVMTPRKGVTP